MSKKIVVLGLLITLVVPVKLFANNQLLGNLHKSSKPSLNLTDAVNKKNFKLTENQEKKISNQGFFITKSNTKSIYEIYEKNRSNGIPNLITTDIILHTAHLLYDYSLKVLEYKELCGDLVDLTHKMVHASERQFSELERVKFEKAARRNLAYFSVAKNLLNPDWNPPKAVEDEVNREVELILRNTDAGISLSPVMGYKLSYSAFKPKGHYTRSDKLKRYFKVINWYGLVNFRLKPGQSSEAIEKGQSETLSALLMARTLKNHRSTLKRWQEVNGQLARFAGYSDDLDPDYYLELSQRIFGDEIELHELASEKYLNKFIATATEEALPPSTLPLWAAEKMITRDMAQSFCFLGKRYDLSANIFQRLVYPHVGTKKQPRNVPSGLDIMASLGSPLAEEILQNRGAFSYENYDRELTKLEREIDKDSLPRIDFEVPNLKLEWLRILEQLVGSNVVSKETSLGSVWNLKQLNTALGSWTELKHDTVLYSKKSRAMSRGLVTMTNGYVEPRPKVYRYIGKFATRLKNTEALPKGLKSKLTDFTNLVFALEDIAGKELSGDDLTEKQYERIFTATKELEKIASLPGYLQEKENRKKSIPRMTLTVDVHEDAQQKTVLQEGVGNPLNVVALVNTAGKVKLVRGGSYSYYEFRRSSSKVLTDEKWAKLLDKSESPDMPAWFRTKVIVENDDPVEIS